MAAQGTYEGGSNTDRERRTPNGARTQGGYSGKPSGDRYPKKDGQNRFSKPADGQSRYGRQDGDRPRGPRPDGDRPRGPRPDGDRPRGPRPDGDRPRGPRPDGGRPDGGYAKKPYDKNRTYNSAPKFPNKDEDEEDNSRRSKSFRPKENKPSVSIPDKNKVQIRIEKEQKSMMKKQQNKKKESNRPQPKVKRANNVNYTKNYANGDYDDYEDYYDM